MKQNRLNDKTYTLPLFDRYLSEGIPGDDLERFTVAAESNELIYHGDPLLYCFVPTVFNQPAKALFLDIAAKVTSICEKVTSAFIESPGYRAFWGLDSLSTELVLADTGYSSLIPIMRADIFLKDATGEFKFCEVNTDGSSAMNEDRCAVKAVEATEMFEKASAETHIRSQELFEPWIDKVSAIYSEWSARKRVTAPPRVAIIDFEEDATMQEFIEFQTRFIERGIDCVVADISDLRYKDGELSVYGQAVNVVYRRATSSEVINDLHRRGVSSLSDIDGSDCEGSIALASGAKYNAAAIVGGFRTLLAHNKKFFEMLWSQETWGFLDGDEIDFIKEHVPRTVSFSRSAVDLPAVIVSKNRWILKPMDGSSTIGVFAGQDHTDEEWEAICKRTIDGSYVLQEYCRQYSSLNSIPQKGMRELSELNYIIGLFIYAGDLAGAYIRAGQGAIIGSIRGSAVVACFWHDAEGESTPTGRQPPRL
jgi:hypothetical protein